MYGALHDQALDLIDQGGVIIKEGVIHQIGQWSDLYASLKKTDTPFDLEHIKTPYVLTPGLVDAHTHLCYMGSRARDFADRLNGIPYLEISRRGGGIKDTMHKTRAASFNDLVSANQSRLNRHLQQGVTTVEIKSGYGLSLDAELKQLRVIQALADTSVQRIIPTCLAAHVCPPEFASSADYLMHIQTNLLPQVKAERLADRVDIFVEDGAFSVHEARSYLKQAQQMGFDCVIHADQFERGGAHLAGELRVRSADHLEVSHTHDLQALIKGGVSAVALPGASMGLGCGFTPARTFLDEGGSLAIASDWNPGSAPMGHLLLQASVLGTFERLSSAEIWAALTFRAAHALNVSEVGRLEVGYQADCIAYPTHDYREIIYQQGMLTPEKVWCKGQSVL
jgi:imidazolonepropionase